MLFLVFSRFFMLRESFASSGIDSAVESAVSAKRSNCFVRCVRIFSCHYTIVLQLNVTISVISISQSVECMLSNHA